MSSAVPHQHGTLLVTSRLLLIPATRQHLLAELNAPEHLATLLGADGADPTWEPLPPTVIQWMIDRAHESEWPVMYIVTRTERQLIGGCGYKNTPEVGFGEVEIGYGIAPAQHGKGYATEFVKAMIEAAFVSPQVARLLAHTNPENAASQRVLTKNGFRRDGTTNDKGEWRLSRERL